MPGTGGGVGPGSAAAAALIEWLYYGDNVYRECVQYCVRRYCVNRVLCLLYILCIVHYALCAVDVCTLCIVHSAACALRVCIP